MVPPAAAVPNEASAHAAQLHAPAIAAGGIMSAALLESSLAVSAASPFPLRPVFQTAAAAVAAGPADGFGANHGAALASSAVPLVPARPQAMRAQMLPMQHLLAAASFYTRGGGDARHPHPHAPATYSMGFYGFPMSYVAAMQGLPMAMGVMPMSASGVHHHSHPSPAASAAAPGTMQPLSLFPVAAPAPCLPHNVMPAAVAASMMAAEGAVAGREQQSVIGDARSAAGGTGAKPTSAKREKKSSVPSSTPSTQGKEAEALRERNNAARRAARAAREQEMTGLRLLAAARWVLEPEREVTARVMDLDDGAHLPTGHFGALSFFGKEPPYRVLIGVPQKATNNTRLLAPLRLDVRRKYGKRCEEKMRQEPVDRRWRCPLVIVFDTPGTQEDSWGEAAQVEADTASCDPYLKSVLARIIRGEKQV